MRNRSRQAAQRVQAKRSSCRRELRDLVCWFTFDHGSRDRGSTDNAAARNRRTGQFNGDLWLHRDVMPALQAPMAVSDALVPERIQALLDPGYHAVENGYCELPDGSAYVASRVPFPGCTGEMYRWWFWWHAIESARYTLWYPYNHVAVTPLEPERLTRPGRTHEHRYVGTTTSRRRVHRWSAIGAPRDRTRHQTPTGRRTDRVRTTAARPNRVHAPLDYLSRPPPRVRFVDRP
jgi:hypothetical protein